MGSGYPTLRQDEGEKAGHGGTRLVLCRTISYRIFASRRSLLRRSSYSSLVISPAAYLLCRS